MLIGILEKNDNNFIGKAFDDKHIQVNNFELDESINVGQVIEIELDGLDYIELTQDMEG